MCIRDRDIGGTQVIVGKDYGIKGGDLVSYAEWGKCGASVGQLHVEECERGALGTMVTIQWEEMGADV